DIVKGLTEEGFRLAVLSRGYGGTAKSSVNLVSDREKIYLGPREAGDEPVLMARALPGTPVLVGKNRVVLGEAAIRRFPLDCLILDDGFQHLPLKRDANLLLLDGVNPFGEEQCLPGGDLREGIRAIHRADVIVLTGSVTEKTLSRLAKLVPDKPRFNVRFVPDYVRPGDSEQQEELSTIRGRRVMAFAGIARTERFFESVRKAGAILAGERSFPDHHPYTAEEVEWIAREGRKKGADYLITTEKDMVRLPTPLLSPPLLALGLKTEIGNRESFLQEIRRRIHWDAKSRLRHDRRTEA
ncbi:MAG: tetraacyldisaccharide 4'-kinase, partial [bacterium]|nr:tetraacyldisaccharide 4'-kinase [bacterium]